jgi:zinc transporter 7
MSENKWAQAFLATTAISVLPNCLLFLIPSSFFLAPAKGKKNLINWTNLLLCFAIAGLLGDVFIHILPHLMGTHSHDHGHGHGHSDAHSHDESHHHETHSVLGHIHDEHHHDEHEAHELHHNDHDHGHDHHDEHDHHHHEDHEEEHDHDHHESHGAHEHKHEHDHGKHDHRSLLTTKTFYDIIGLERALAIQTTILFGFFVFFLAEKIAKSFLSDDDGHSHHHHHGEEKKEQKTTSNTQVVASKGFFGKLAATGWLNLLADSMHNFTDGIAIGAAYVSGRGIGLATCISVILHEIPHEIGDFTILVQSGLR